LIELPILTLVPYKLILPLAHMLSTMGNAPMISQLLMLLETTAHGMKTIRSVENMMTLNSHPTNNVALVVEEVQLLMKNAHLISQLLINLETTAHGIRRTH